MLSLAIILAHYNAKLYAQHECRRFIFKQMKEFNFLYVNNGIDTTVSY